MKTLTTEKDKSEIPQIPQVTAVGHQKKRQGARKMIELEVLSESQLEWAQKISSQAFEHRKNKEADVWKEIGLNRKQYFMPVNQLYLGMEVSSFLKKKGVLSIKSINTKEIDIGIDRDINRFFGATKEQLWFMPNEKAGEHQDALNKSTPDNWWLEAAIIKNDLIGFKEIFEVLRPNLLNIPISIVFKEEFPTVYLNLKQASFDGIEYSSHGRKIYLKEDNLRIAKNIQKDTSNLLKNFFGDVVIAGRLPILSTPMPQHQEQQIDLGDWLGEKD